MLACKALAALLLYPDAELVAALPEIPALLREAGLPPAETAAVAAFCDRLGSLELMAAQSDYVALFDRSAALSLYLFEHVHGESRERGQAMADLVADYQRAGLDMTAGELPDFLPVFLEYVSMQPPAQARVLLGEITDIVALLAGRLEKRGSGYAAVLRAVEALAAQPADREAVAARIAEDKPDDTPAALDALWEEAPVSFMEPSATGESCPKAADLVAQFAPDGTETRKDRAHGQGRTPWTG
jgi:nitrate reductase delta subunit